MTKVLKFEPRSIGFKPENLKDLQDIKEAHTIDVGVAPSTSAIIRSLVSKEAERLRQRVSKLHTKIVKENT